MTVYLQNVIDTYDNCFILFDQNHEVVTVNRVYRDVFGIAAENVIGKKYRQIFRHTNTDIDCGDVLDPVQAVVDSRAACRVSLLLVNVQDEEFNQEVFATPVYSDSDELYIGMTLTNVNPRYYSKPKTDLFLGTSAMFSACMTELDIASASDDAVLLNGETGSGKTVAASYIHEHSSRSVHHLLVIDCPSITPGIFESEFFGYKKGAFADSVKDHNGLIDLADKGIILFDEIAEMSLFLQGRLVRFIETGEFRRLGGREDIECDVRIICTTQKNLSVLVSQGLFLPDLYRLISGISITVPPLRERRNDITQLVNSIVNPYGLKQGITDAAMEKLLRYDYPGNFRELENILFNASNLAQQNIIDVADLKLDDLTEVEEERRVSDSYPQSPDLQQGIYNNESENIKIPATNRPLSEVFATHLETLLHLHNGHRGKVAKELKISERTLYRKMKYYKMLDVGRKVRLHYGEPVRLVNDFA